MADPENPDPLTKITGYIEFKDGKISFKNVTKYWWVGVLLGAVLWLVIRHVIFG